MMDQCSEYFLHRFFHELKTKVRYSPPCLTIFMNIEEYDCQFCGRKAKQFCFAAFVCESEDCIDKAREERGGPAGHMKNKKEWAEIIQVSDKKP
jgi:hypothetical protein